MVPSNPSFHFHWNSPLGYSVMLFLLVNLMYLIIGVLTPIAFRLYGTQLTHRFGLVFSPRSDVAAFGKSSADLIHDQPAAQYTKVTIYYMLSGLYLAVAILHFCLVWFGLRSGQPWALWALTFANLSIVLLFFFGVRYFSTHVTPLSLGDLYPYVLLPAVVFPIASVLGWIGIT